MGDRDQQALWFHAAMLDICAAAWDACRYNPNYFRNMVNQHGGVEAARRLLRSAGLSDGLTTLWECQRLDPSVEALILQARWHELFTDKVRAIARRRLAELGYDPERA